MFNFSIGGPKDYKKIKSQVAMMDNDKVKTYAVVGAIAVGVAILINNSEWPAPGNWSSFCVRFSQEVNEIVMAKGYGCGCGHNLYQQVEDFVEESEDDNWEHQYRLCKVWQCENCKTIYEYIGGSIGPKELIN